MGLIKASKVQATTAAPGSASPFAPGSRASIIKGASMAPAPGPIAAAAALTIDDASAVNGSGDRTLSTSPALEAVTPDDGAVAGGPVVIPTVDPLLPPPVPAGALTPSPQVAAEIVASAEAEAKDIVSAAQREARKLIDESKLYCQSAFAQSQRDGFVQGKEEGIAAGRDEAGALTRQAKDLLDQMIAERTAILHSIEPEVARLAIKIAERLVTQEVTAHPDVALKMVQQAMTRVRDREQVTLRVAPADADLVREHKDLFARMVEGLRHLEILSDPRVERGGCVIETNLGNVDARISTQLAALELAFREIEAVRHDADQPAGA